ncbi:mitochondrial large subunit ribosomal protein-domain-containing protein [Hypoxylon rubiginosum]|uniref:Mitochondrial large subunit ribosomal protein-domain-containing protein n=1 Tax=Hypoxylon rubiginosum TaxID=110542 RepID=A0ACB9YW31_9PEZI|nr:mitochondrial large subunit ribosomal protein-domain-containing protein [Hypoxylon rubiginosum]
MFLPRVLRPFAVPRAPLSLFSPRFILPVRTRYLSTTIEQSSSPDLATPHSPEPTSPSTQPESQNPSPLPYFVSRNNLNNLSVYQRNKRGGNRKVTILKNGEGDLKALKQDIKEALQLNDGDLSINSVTNHIEIKGQKKVEVLNFLATMGF